MSRYCDTCFAQPGQGHVAGCYTNMTNHEDGPTMSAAENPKAARARTDKKSRLELLEPLALERCAAALAHGAAKYGERNYREVGTIDQDVYKGALLRHVLAWSEGEAVDPDSGLSHLAHIEACCHVIAGAEQAGTYRPTDAPAVNERSLAGDPATNRELNGLNKIVSGAWPEPYSGRDPDEPSIIDMGGDPLRRRHWDSVPVGTRFENCGHSRETLRRSKYGVVPISGAAPSKDKPDSQVVDMGGSVLIEVDYSSHPVGTVFTNVGHDRWSYRRTFTGVTPIKNGPAPRSAI